MNFNVAYKEIMSPPPHLTYCFQFSSYDLYARQKAKENNVIISFFCSEGGTCGGVLIKDN